MRLQRDMRLGRWLPALRPVLIAGGSLLPLVAWGCSCGPPFGDPGFDFMPGDYALEPIPEPIHACLGPAAPPPKGGEPQPTGPGDDAGSLSIGQSTIRPPRALFHPVPTRPVFAPRSEYSPPVPLGIKVERADEPADDADSEDAPNQQPVPSVEESLPEPTDEGRPKQSQTSDNTPAATSQRATAPSRPTDPQMPPPSGAKTADSRPFDSFAIPVKVRLSLQPPMQNPTPVDAWRKRGPQR